jgi:hypothetical protein
VGECKLKRAPAHRLAQNDWVLRCCCFLSLQIVRGLPVASRALNYNWRSNAAMASASSHSSCRQMPNLNDTDTQLLQIVAQAAPASIADVIAIMQRIDGLLPSNDGLKWFNKLYLMVTQQIDTQTPPGGWEDATWLTRLDVMFASFYFAAITGALKQDPENASSWDALFEARSRPGIDRIQFAFAG